MRTCRRQVRAWAGRHPTSRFEPRTRASLMRMCGSACSDLAHWLSRSGHPYSCWHTRASHTSTLHAAWLIPWQTSAVECNRATEPYRLTLRALTLARVSVADWSCVLNRTCPASSATHPLPSSHGWKTFTKPTFDSGRPLNWPGGGCGVLSEYGVAPLFSASCLSLFQ